MTLHVLFRSDRSISFSNFILPTFFIPWFHLSVHAMGKLRMTEEQILEGEPKEVLGFVRVEKEYFLLVRWTTGKVYMSYDFMREHFPIMVMDYYSKNLEFRSLFE